MALHLQHINESFEGNPSYYVLKEDSLLKSIWRQPVTVQENEAYLLFLVSVAYEKIIQGEIHSSIDWYEKALQFYETSHVGEFEFEEFICKPLGNNYTKLGSYSRALYIQQRAIDSATANKRISLLPSLYSNLAKTYFSLGEYSTVVAHCNNGLKYCQSADPVKGLLYNVLAETYTAAGKTDSARMFNSSALIFFNKLKNNDWDKSWRISALITRADLLSLQARYKEAASILEEVWQQYMKETAYNFREKSKVAAALANIYNKLNQPGNSQAWCRQTLFFFKLNKEQLYPDNTVTDIYFLLGQVNKLQHPDSASIYYQLAVLNDYYTQQLIPSSYISQQQIDQVNMHTADAISFAYEQYRRTKQESDLTRFIWLIEISKGRKLLEQQKVTGRWASTGKLQYSFDALRYSYQQLAGATDSIEKKMIVDKIAQQEFELQLKSGAANRLLEAPSAGDFYTWLQKNAGQNNYTGFYVTDNAVFYYYYSSEKKECIKVDEKKAAKDELEDFIKTYFGNSPSAFANDPGLYYRRADTVRRQLLPFVEQTAKPLVVSPDAILYKLPVEALYNETQKKYLGEMVAVHYTHSLLQMQLHEPSKELALPLQILSLENKMPGFALLQNASVERKMLTKSFVAAYQFADTTSEENLFSLLRQPVIMHIATHAVVPEDNGQPYLQLRQKLNLGALQYITTRTPLIVLTACQTTDGTLWKGEGNVSLMRTFISKGVNGVVASRWQVDDAIAPEFIQNFYKALEEDAHPAVALQAAAKAYLQKNHANVAAQNPWYWAGFCYYGIDQQVKPIKRSSPFLLYGALPGAFLFLLAAYLFFKRRK